MKKIIIFGGTGFIGQSLAKHLAEQEFKPILVARNSLNDTTFEFKQWDAKNIGHWIDCLEGAYAIINLCGRTVDCIKTPENCDEILRSRVNATFTIGNALKQVKNKPQVWVQMSTAHIYGDSPNELCGEDSHTGYGLAPFVGKAWEKAFLKSLPSNMRGVRLRTSFVIGKNGGALKSLKNLVRFGLGGKVGNGRQGISWIHEYDMNELVCNAIKNEKYKGIYIASAPNPVSNKNFMKALRVQMNMPIGINSSKSLVKLGAKLFLKTDPDLVIYGRYVKSERLEKEGFSFKYPNIDQALKDLI